jgi:hypothetical protein
MPAETGGGSHLGRGRLTMSTATGMRRGSAPGLTEGYHGATDGAACQLTAARAHGQDLGKGSRVGSVSDSSIESWADRA